MPTEREGNMAMEKGCMELAKKLHQSVPVVDAHLDLAGELFFRVQNGEQDPLRRHYLEDLRTGGVNLLVSSVYLRDDQAAEGGLRAALDQISVLMEEVERNEAFCLVRTAGEMEQAFREDRIGILLYMEGLDCIGRDLKLLRILWELGVRGASLTWSRRNLLGNGCCRAGQQIQIPGGLPPEGVEAIKEMERLGMFLDISHLNDEGFEEVCRIAERPFCATHSNSRQVHFNYRNLTDVQMERLAAQGGVMGLNGCDLIVGCTDGEDALPLLCRHVEHETAVMGPGHVGLGLDFCDSYTEAEPKYTYRESHSDCLVNHSHLPELTAMLLQRGMAEEQVTKVISGSWADYFRRVLPK